MLFERLGVGGLVSVGEDPAVDLRMECLDPAVEDLGKTGDLGHRSGRDSGVLEGAEGSAGRYQLEAQLLESPGEVDQPCFVPDGQQRSHRLQKLPD